MKTYVIILAKTFPKGHSRHGELTRFREFLIRVLEEYSQDEIGAWDCWPVFINDGKKMHTIRGNFDLWEKRFKEIEEGRACLSVREWEGKPYDSKQSEIVRLTKEDGIGLQKLTFVDGRTFVDGLPIKIGKIVYNDGMQWDDFKEWFKGCDTSEPFAIIHFTKFRYNEEYASRRRLDELFV